MTESLSRSQDLINYGSSACPLEIRKKKEQWGAEAESSKARQLKESERKNKRSLVCPQAWGIFK